MTGVGGISIWQLLIVSVIVVIYLLARKGSAKTKKLISTSKSSQQQSNTDSQTSFPETNIEYKPTPAWGGAEESKTSGKVKANLPVKRGAGMKHPIVLIIVAAAVILGLYYIMSPYQNCMREGNVTTFGCQKLSSW